MIHKEHLTNAMTYLFEAMQKAVVESGEPEAFHTALAISYATEMLGAIMADATLQSDPEQRKLLLAFCMKRLETMMNEETNAELENPRAV